MFRFRVPGGTQGLATPEKPEQRRESRKGILGVLTPREFRRRSRRENPARTRRPPPRPDTTRTELSLFPTFGVGLLDFQLNSSPRPELFSSPGLLLETPQVPNPRDSLEYPTGVASLWSGSANPAVSPPTFPGVPNPNSWSAQPQSLPGMPNPSFSLECPTQRLLECPTPESPWSASLECPTPESLRCSK